MALIDKIKKVVKKDESEKKAQEGGSTKLVTGNNKKNNKDAIIFHNILLEPYITEKTSQMGQENKYVFKVSKFVNKIDIKKAVESIFKVSVVNVATALTVSRKVRLGRHEGRKPGFKKAIITLKEGDKIDIGI